MPSRFGWVDFAEEDREQMLRVVDLFREQGTQDELGIGTIRDALADCFFPGTSTIQTRARYFLFVPWIYKDIEDHEISSAEVAVKARRAEVRLIHALLDNGERHGVIGQEAKDDLRRLPSSVYWSGLSTWGIRLFGGSQDQYHRYMDVYYRRRQNITVTDDKEPIAGGARQNWDPGLPDAPAHFPDGATMALTRQEAQYLQDHVSMRHPESLLAKLLLGDRHYEAEHLWQHPSLRSLPERLKTTIGHARNFSETIYGSALLYNGMMADARHVDQWSQQYRSGLAEWAKCVQGRWEELVGWHRDMATFWSLPPLVTAAIPRGTRLFVDQWLDILFSQGAEHVSKSPEAKRLIVERENQLKHNRARLSNKRALELWNGASGTRQLDFRWGNASTLLRDIHAGLVGGANDA